MKLQSRASVHSRATRAQRGFSMVEMLVTIAVFGVASSAVLGLVAASHRTYAVQRATVETAAQGRAAADLMVRELRMAGFPAKNAYLASAGLTWQNSNLVAATFVAAEASRVAFESDLDFDGIVERIEYRLNGTVLERGRALKLGDGSAPAPAWETVLSGVVNGSSPVFTYQTDPFSASAFPLNVNQVRVSLVLRSAVPDPKNGSFRTFAFDGLALRHNPER